MIHQRFVVQLERHTVGIAVRVPGGFVFYASDDAFDEMDGHTFSRVRAIEQELARLANGQDCATAEGRSTNIPASKTRPTAYPIH